MWYNTPPRAEVWGGHRDSAGVKDSGEMTRARRRAATNVLAFPAWRPARVPSGKGSPARPGIAWRLTDEDDNLQVCTIEPPIAGSRAGWHVSVWLNETKLFSRRCADAAAADFVANALKQDQLLGGAVPVGRLRQFKRR